MDEHGFPHDGEHNCHCTGMGCDCDEKRYGNPSSGNNGGMSTIGAILCTIGAFVGAALFFMVLGIDVDNVPVIVILIVIVVIAAILGVIGSKHNW